MNKSGVKGWNPLLGVEVSHLGKVSSMTGGQEVKTGDRPIFSFFMRSKVAIMIWSPDRGIFHEIDLLKKMTFALMIVLSISSKNDFWSHEIQSHDHLPALLLSLGLAIEKYESLDMIAWECGSRAKPPLSGWET